MAKIDTLCEVRVQNVFQILVRGLKYVQTTPRQVLMTMEFRSKICFFCFGKVSYEKNAIFVCVREAKISHLELFEKSDTAHCQPAVSWPSRVIHHGKY